MHVKYRFCRQCQFVRQRVQLTFFIPLSLESIVELASYAYHPFLQSWQYPDLRLRFFSYLAERGLLGYYIQNNFKLPVAANKPLVLPIERHLNLMQPGEESEGQKSIMLGPQNEDDNELEGSLGAITMNEILSSLESPTSSSNIEMQQQQQDINNSMNFQHPVYHPHEQLYANSAWIPPPNAFPQQQPPLPPQNFAQPAMPADMSGGFQQVFHPYGQAPMNQQPAMSHPHNVDNANMFIHISVPIGPVSDLVCKLFQQATCQHQQQQQATDTVITQQEPYNPPTEPITPPNN